MKDAFSEVSHAVDVLMREYVDSRSERTGETRDDLSVDVGKALVMLGCTFLGNAIGITDPEAGLQPGRDCLKQFEQLLAARN